MNTYKHAEWIRFREEVIKLDGGRCIRCRRSRADGVVLQVHHKSYAPGRSPWEYLHTECETLCKGCHAQEHGIIMPQSDWTLVATDDLGELGGHCEYCNTELRYIYAIVHPEWGSMAVGTDCCDRLTMSSVASDYHHRYMKDRDRRARFLTSSRWKWQKEAWSIKQRKIEASIVPVSEKYRISIEGIAGTSEYATLVDAKLKVFDFIESGDAAIFLERHRQKEQMRRHAELAKAGRLVPASGRELRVFTYYC